MRLCTLSTLLLGQIVTTCLAQTYTDCDPLLRSDCPADPAFPSELSSDFRQGQPSLEGWKVVGGDIQFVEEGAHLSIQQRFDNPTLMSTQYLLFGYVEVKVRAAAGQGIVTAIVLQSDDRDEVDWEFTGTVPNSVQTDYFGKGNTTTFDRRIDCDTKPDNQGDFHIYAINWTETELDWFIDGSKVRTLHYVDAVGGKNYPQTPLNVRVGIWAGGDPGNNDGTISWAGGLTNYSQAPFTMAVESIRVVNYNPAKEYRFTDNTGSWQSIEITPDDQNISNPLSSTISSLSSTPFETSQFPSILAPAVTASNFTISQLNLTSLEFSSTKQPAIVQQSTSTAGISCTQTPSSPQQISTTQLILTTQQPAVLPNSPGTQFSFSSASLPTPQSFPIVSLVSTYLLQKSLIAITDEIGVRTATKDVQMTISQPQKFDNADGNFKITTSSVQVLPIKTITGSQLTPTLTGLESSISSISSAMTDLKDAADSTDSTNSIDPIDSIDSIVSLNSTGSTNSTDSATSAEEISLISAIRLLLVADTTFATQTTEPQPSETLSTNNIFCKTFNNSKYSISGGTEFQIYCGLDIGSGGSIIFAPTFAACLEVCSSSLNCAGVSYNNQAEDIPQCYLRTNTGTTNYDENIYGAIKLSGQPPAIVVDQNFTSSTSTIFQSIATLSYLPSRPAAATASAIVQSSSATLSELASERILIRIALVFSYHAVILFL